MLRRDMAEMRADIRTEMAQMGGSIRQETAQIGGDIRQEMGQMGSGIRQEIASGCVEMLKWCFLFWIGQLVTIASIAGLMLRLIR